MSTSKNAYFKINNLIPTRTKYRPTPVHSQHAPTEQWYNTLLSECWVFHFKHAFGSSDRRQISPHARCVYRWIDWAAAFGSGERLPPACHRLNGDKGMNPGEGSPETWCDSALRTGDVRMKSGVEWHGMGRTVVAGALFLTDARAACVWDSSLLFM